MVARGGHPATTAEAGPPDFPELARPAQPEPVTRTDPMTTMSNHDRLKE